MKASTRAYRHMRRSEASFERRVEEYWDWFAVALFLLITVDLLTTMGAAVEYGLAAETNPLMAWLIHQGPVILTVVNVAAVVVATVCFSHLIETVRRAPSPYDRYLERGLEVWLAALLVAGLVVFANNLTVVVWGSSLL